MAQKLDKKEHIGVSWMQSIVKLLKESVGDLLKDNVKTVIISLATASVPFILSLFTTLNNIELTFNLPVVIGAISVLIILAFVIVQILNRNKALKKENYELQHPENQNVNKFNKGDIVIRKIEANNSSAKTFSVMSKTRSEIECRKMDGQVISFAPEELLTAAETKDALENSRLRKAASVQLIASANKRKGSRGYEW